MLVPDASEGLTSYIQRRSVGIGCRYIVYDCFSLDDIVGVIILLLSRESFLLKKNIIMALLIKKEVIKDE